MDFFRYIEQQTNKIEESYRKARENLTAYEAQGTEAIVTLKKFADVLEIEEPNISYASYLFCSPVLYFETREKTSGEILTLINKHGYLHSNTNEERFSFLFNSQYITVDKTDSGYTRVGIRMSKIENFLNI